MPEVHHDLAWALEIVEAPLVSHQHAVGEIEGNTDDGLAGGAAPLVGEVEVGREALETARAKLANEPLREPLHRRAVDGQLEIPNRRVELPGGGIGFGRQFRLQFHDPRALRIASGPPRPPGRGRGSVSPRRRSRNLFRGKELRAATLGFTIRGESRIMSLLPDGCTKHRTCRRAAGEKACGFSCIRRI